MMPFVMRPLQPIPEMEVYAPMAMQEYVPDMRRRLVKKKPKKGGDADKDDTDDKDDKDDTGDKDDKDGDEKKPADKKKGSKAPKKKGPKSSAPSHLKSVPLLMAIILLINWFVNIL